MTFKEELTDFIYRYIMTSCIGLFLFMEIYNYYDAEFISRKNILILLAVSLCFNTLVILYNKIHFYIFPAIILVVTLFSFLIDKEDVDLLLSSNIFKLVIIGFVAFIVFLISDLTVVINLILSASLLFYVLLQLFKDGSIHPASTAIACFYIAFTFTRFLRSSDKDRTPARVRRYITYLLPFLLLVLICVLVIPKPEDPISWNWAKKLYRLAVEEINKIGHKLSLKFSGSGSYDSLSVEFGSEDTMSYDNDSDDSIRLMELSSQTKTYGSIYLNGQYFNKFDNGNWHNTLDANERYSLLDAFESYYGLINFDRTAVSGAVRNTYLRIKYIDLASSILFTPAKTLDTFDAGFKSSLDLDDEKLLFDDVMTYGTEYNVNYMQMNYGSRVVNEFLEAPLSDDPEAFNYTKFNFLRNMYPDITLDLLSSYRDYIKKSYTSSPLIRDSVKDWIDTVIKDCNTDYEKLSALERTFAAMTYDLSGGFLPDYVSSEGDFLNYFIIEKQSGYCVHFATAFCLAARYLGYSSRVVQGYVVPSSESEEYTVINGNGHTWPEVYFENKGWVAFEPTPGYAPNRYSGWKLYSGKYSDFEGVKDNSDFEYHFDDEDVTIPDLVEDPDYEKDHTEQKVSWLLIIIIVTIIVISLLLLLLVNAVVSYRRRKKMNERQLYIYDFNLVLHVLKEFNLRRGSDETLEEFSRRYTETIGQTVAGSKPDASFETLSDTGFINVFESVVYGNTEPTDADRSSLKSLKKTLLLLMRRFYRRTYLIHRFRTLF